MHRTIPPLCLFAAVAASVAQPALAQEFRIQIANPVAAQSYQMKRSAFVFRTLGCAAPAKPEVTAIAEGKVNGNRRSMPLKVVPASTPGVYGIFHEWPQEGTWIVNITGHCSSATAAVLVATNDKGFIRESSVFFAHAPAEADITAALKSAPHH